MSSNPPPPPHPYCWRAVGGTIWNHKTSDDDEPLYDQITLDASVAAERERLRVLVEAVRDANCHAEDADTFRLLKPGQERAWIALLDGLKGPNVKVTG